MTRGITVCTQRYLILRCLPQSTLRLSQLHPELYCPTTTILIRHGPSRSRTTKTIPLLPSFLFLPTSFSIPNTSRLRLMQRPTPSLPPLNPLPPELGPRSPPSPYFICTRLDLDVMLTYTSFPHSSITPSLGQSVLITQGLLCGIQGIVTQIRTNGDITLKVKEDLGWQINACTVNESVLQCL